MVKKEPLIAGDINKRRGFDAWVGKIPRAWQSSLVLLPEESHGEELSSLGPWGHGV